ncbi:MAG: WYL domain-containing protein [Crocinitomicaceae bacterium]|nr:WYL domain-containing protein [Crocinitomicaceae bacterium]MDG1657271.1 WYL domain-containing protein [Crocinitomicaceae bacterium]
MPHIKNALIRYRIIDKAIRNKYKPFPSKMELREACEEALFGSIDGAHICDSTIEKDMFSMKMEHDAPIKYSKREKGYYYSDPDFSINDIPLTDDDLSSISFAAKTLMQFRDVDLFKQFGNAIDKIVGHVEVSQDGGEQFIQFEQAIANSGNEYLSPLLEAIKQSLWVEFDYSSFVSGKSKPRRVIPLLLKEYRNRWYLISHDHDKNDFITYSLDRLSDLIVTSDKADCPPDFKPENYFKYAIGITSGNEDPEQVVFKASPVAAKYIDSQPFHSSQEKTKELKDGVTFSLTVNVSEELIRALLSYGGEVKIIQPKTLKAEIQRRAKSILEG